MCFILDSNSFSKFFNPECDDFIEFKPLHSWLFQTSGVKLIIGGSQYKRELSKLSRYHKYLIELGKARKIANISDEVVDEETTAVKSKESDPDFDDPHMVALIIVSGCKIFASHDKRADKFIKKRKLYPKGTSRPSIYRNKSHVNLLNPSNIINIKNIAKP